MSKRNSQSAKTAARERLRQERERQAKRDKARRQVIVAASVVAVLAAAGGIGYAVVQANKPSGWEAVKDQKLVKPANTTGADGTTVVLGKSTAKKTLAMYEDPRCPVCAQFEQSVGPAVKKDFDAGKFKIQFVGATFIDNNIPGVGSKNALSALGAALNVSPEAFLQYKSALYSTKWHPNEQDDKFKDDAYLIKVADTVSALKGNAAFQKDVKNGTFDKWALVMNDKFNSDGKKYDFQGTPTLVMDGKKVTGSDGKNAPMSAEEFDTALDKALKG
ncbi:thioredoxin domain-containing protein [Streptomyces sp. SID486]|uniref:thioredoxin domain-containing protein n=1 Tax=unclassified Streptomyces TaxID=2593676 RepID=UPI00136C4F40|nr:MULTISPECIES: thioredoxin domain-containing protein [unclassified Streptomyces]MYW48522.1 thioredoxin domain-containing protein [Streptomyces sp. SID161]MYX98637.1 thioredoxin domain-containing protein [Streptomyces sp. SID486]